MNIEKLSSNGTKFPPNGRELNKKLILSAQHATTLVQKNKYIDELIKLNMRVIGIVKRNHGNGFSMSELLSIFYDVMESAVRGYDFVYDTSKNSFLNYLIIKFRAKIAIARWDAKSVVHFPSTSKKIPAEGTSDSEVMHEVYAAPEEEDDMSNDLTILIDLYEKTDLDDIEKENLEVLKLSRSFNRDDIRRMPHNNYTKFKVEKRLADATASLLKFKKEIKFND